MSLLLPHARTRSLAVLVVAVLAAPLLGASPAAAAAPANDARASATDIGTLPVTINGTTVEATVEADEPASGCSSTKSSVWYRFTPTKAARSCSRWTRPATWTPRWTVFTRVRSQLSNVGCATTNRRGEATLDVDVNAGTEYLVRVAPLANSVADKFVLRVVAPDEPAKAPGSPLPRTGTAATVDRFANPDDAWYVDLVGGRTYRMNFVTKGEGCADVELFPPAPRASAAPARSGIGPATRTRCSSPARPAATRSSSAPRGPPATLSTTGSVSGGAGRRHRSRPAARGRLDASAGRLTAASSTPSTSTGSAWRTAATCGSGWRTERRFELTLDDRRGHALARRGTDRRAARPRPLLRGGPLRWTAPTGAYVAAPARPRHHVGPHPGRRPAQAPRVGRDRNVSLTLRVSPAVYGPATMLVERFDPIEGWLFAARFRPHVSAGTATVTRTTRPALGRCRVAGTFDGTFRGQPQRRGHGDASRSSSRSR